MGYRRVKLIKGNSYPGDGYAYSICDVCGRKIRQKDGTLIKDRFNYLNNMFVCSYDVDKTNPQTQVKAVKERQISNPELIRPEQPDNFVFISDPSEIEGGDTSDPTGRNPSATRHLEIFEVTSTTISFQWQGPLDPGSSVIKGWKIERESPVGGGFSTVVENTGEGSMYYEDTGLTANTQYNYRVSAINKTGTGSASNEAAATTAA